ncbi:ribonuclease H-like domain-containing protein [Tanacetum coccineum]
MDPNSSLGKICLGEDVVVISSDKVEGSRDWNSPEFQDTANSGKKKETKGMVFYQMDTEEVSDRFVAPCFINGMEAYDCEINLGVEENMISNEYAVKLCLEHEEDDVEHGVGFGRSFLCMTKAITDFGVGTITIYLDIDPFFEETDEEGKSNDDWDHLLNFNIDDIPLLGEEGLSPFVCKMGKSSSNKKRAMEYLNFFYQDIGTSSSAGEEERPIIETMAYHDKYTKILDEVWKDKVELDGKIVKEDEEAVKKIKGEALKEKDDPDAFIFPIRLEGQVNENALADTGSDINTMPYRIYEQLGREDMKKVDRGITMINHTQAEAMGKLTNVLCQVGVTTLIAKFLILDILIDHDSPIVVGRGFLRTISGIVNTPERLFSTFDGFCHQTFRAARSNFMRNAKSDSDDEEDYQIKRNKFGAPKISVWKKAVSFLGSLPVPLKQVNWKRDYKGSYTKEEEATGQWQTEIRLTDPCGNVYLQGFTTKKMDRKLSKYHKKYAALQGSAPHILSQNTMGTHDDEVGSSRSKRFRQHETVEEVLLPQIHHEFLLWEGCHRDAKSRYNTRLAQLLPRHIYSPCIVNWDVLNRMGYDREIDDMLRIRLREAESDEEIFISVACIRAFNINEPIYAKLCYEFYSTYEFDEVCTNDELQTKKIIKFRLGGHAHSLTLLEFARRLGLYHADELEEDGFNVYFERGLRSDEQFNAQDYWLSISREENLGLSKSYTSTIRNPILRVIHKMITYSLCQRTTRYDKIQKNDLWLFSMFDARHQNRYANVDLVIARWMKRKGAGTQKESQICCGQFISKIDKKCRVLTEDVVRSLSAPIYCRDLDTITLRDLINSDGKLIPKDPQPGVPRVGIPRPLRASM